MANRQTTFLIKRSNVPGKVPPASGLTSGELALNTADAILYTSGSTANQILPIGWDRLSTLSGGTVYGPTIFTNGLSAHTLFVSGLTQTSGITSTGGIIFPQKTINSTYTAQTEDFMIDASGGTFTIYLPTAVGVQGKLYNIKNNGGGAVTVQPFGSETIDDKPFVILGETNALQLVSNGSDWVALGYNISTVNSSTGVFEFTGITTASTTTFYVSPVKGWIVDDTSNPLSPQIYYLSYSGGVNTDNFVNTSTETFVFLNSGGTISQQSTPLSEQQRRQNIFLGKLSHPDKTSIYSVFSQPDFVLSPLGQLRDMFTPINLINGGILPSTNGANLKFNTSAGYLYGLGINFANNTLSPNTIYVTGENPRTFQYRTQTGATLTDVTDIDPLNYDLGGVITPITGTKATNQRIYLQQDGSVVVMYGQQNYNTLALAISALQNESFISFPNLSTDAVLIGVLSVLSTATDLTDETKAKFFFASKFGETIGAAGGTSTTNLQQAYNNSTSPEITTNSILGGVQFKGGTGNDNDKNIIVENNAGVETAWITASGDSKFNSLSATSVYTNYIDFNTAYVPTVQEGRLHWDVDYGTLDVDLEGNNVSLKVGLDNLYYIKNQSGATINKGRVVRASGTLGTSGRILGEYMIADGTIPYYFTLGIAGENILNGEDGYVYEFGLIRGVNTTGSLYGETWVDGTILYVSPTIPGGLTSFEPTEPNLKIQMAIVIDAAVNGSLFVRPSLGYNLGDLHNVQTSGQTNGDLISYNSSQGYWEYTKTLNGNYTISGNTTQIGNYNVTGNTNQIGSFNISGHTTGCTLSVTGNTCINGNLDVVGDVVVVGDLVYDGDLIVTGGTVVQNGFTANTITISDIPNLNNNLTQILGRNETTGVVEYRNVNTIGNNYTYVSGATYSALTTDNVIGVDSSISATTIYLPNSVTSGRLRYDVKDIGLNSYINNITFIANGTDTIIGVENTQTLILDADGGAIILFNTGTGTWLQM